MSLAIHPQRLWRNAKKVGRRIPGLRRAWRALRAIAQPSPFPCRARFHHSLFPTEQAVRFFRGRPGPAYLPSLDQPSVLHCVGGIGPGGAERQLCNLLIALADSRWDATVLHFSDLKGDDAHFLPLLRNSGIQMHRLPAMDTPLDPPTPFWLAGLSDGTLPHLFDLCHAFRLLRPDIVHCWMDYTNVIAGLAAILVGVPSLIFSTRSVAPTHFSLFQPWFLPWYQLLAEHPAVHFINNSQAGAKDYARWIGIPAEQFRVIYNGVNLDTVRPAFQETVEFRKHLGIPMCAPLVTGVFRLSEEKQPAVFVEVIHQVLRHSPDTHSVIAGVGELAAGLRRLIADKGLESRIHLLGRCNDVPLILSAADVVLLTSRAEGTPNVLLEAQALGCPVVATRTGGVEETVEDGQTGLLAPVGDVAGITAAVLEVLVNRPLRVRFGQAGQAFVRQRFGLQRMVNDTGRLYEKALAPFQPKTPVHRKSIGARSIAIYQDLDSSSAVEKNGQIGRGTAMSEVLH